MLCVRKEMTGGSIQLMTGMNESKYQRTWLLICSVTKKYPVIGTLERVAEDTRWGSGVVIGSCIIDILFVFALCSYISYKSWRVEVFIYHACNQEDGKLVGTELIEWFLFWWVYVRCIMRSRYIYMQPKHVSLFVLFRASYYNTPSDYFFCQEKKKKKYSVITCQSRSQSHKTMEKKISCYLQTQLIFRVEEYVTRTVKVLNKLNNHTFNQSSWYPIHLFDLVIKPTAALTFLICTDRKSVV